MELKPSIYNHRVPLTAGRALLYNALSRALVLLEPDDIAALDALGTPSASAPPAPSATLRQFVHQGFAVRADVDELQIVAQLYEQARFSSRAINFIVCSTLACNFGCDYCFQGIDKPVEVMQPDVQDGIVAMFERVLDQRPELNQVQFVWYGGEPLVKKKIIIDLADRLIPIARARGISYSAMMVSNGYLLDGATAEALFARGLRAVQITLDGSRAMHDARRHLLSKRGTYDRILDNLQAWIDLLPIHVQIRVNIDARNKDDITNLIDDLAARGFAGRRNFKMYFSPVESVTQGCDGVHEKLLRKLDYGQLEADLYRYAWERGLADVPYAPRFLGICSALRPNDFILVPNGDIHKCWDTVTFPAKRVGNIFDNIDILASPNPNKAVWDTFNPFDNEICRSCKLLPNCSGYCAHKFIYPTDAQGESILPCPSIKYSINERLVMRAEQERFITAADYQRDAIKTDPYQLTPKMHTVASMQGEARSIPLLTLTAHVA
jgi:uncharacterized protein